MSMEWEILFVGGPFDGKRLVREPTDAIVVNDPDGVRWTYRLTSETEQDGGAIIYRLVTP